MGKLYTTYAVDTCNQINMGLPETASKFKCYNLYLEKGNDKKKYRENT